jgi:hypothetical protein
VLDLWEEIKVVGEPESAATESANARLARLNELVSPSMLARLNAQATAYVAGDARLSGLTVCHGLEQSTPLLLLNLITRSGARNRLSTGLQQTYGDHTRMLAYGIDQLLAGETAWLYGRVWPGSGVSEADVARCVEAIAALHIDRTQRLALWVAASLHDYGKLYGRRNGLDPEDGVALVAPIVAAIEPIRELADVVTFAVRNHDLIESVTTGGTPASFVAEQLRRLPAAQRQLAMAFLGVIQLAGAASLGMGRIVASKVEIFEQCLSGDIVADESPQRRASALCSAALRGDHHFVTVADEIRATELDSQTRDFLGRVVLHGWEDVRHDLWSKRGAEAFAELNAILVGLAGIMAAQAPDGRHLVIDDSAAERLVDSSAASLRVASTQYDRAANGEGFLTVS